MIKIIRNTEAPAVAERCPPVVMTVVTDPDEIAAFRAQQERIDRNADWLQAHAHEVYSQNRGRHICIAGQELFVADTAKEALALAEAAHPEDDGWHLRYVPK